MAAIERAQIRTRHRLWIWVLLLFCGALSGWLFPQWLDPMTWSASLRPLGGLLWLAILILQCACSVLMLPGLPLVLASALLFPDQPGYVLMLAVFGVLLSSLTIYASAGFVGLGALGSKRPAMRRARWWIRRHGSPALCLWCMAPFLPTDMACYMAASAKMPLSRYLPAVLIGESVLCASLIYGTVGILGRSTGL